MILGSLNLLESYVFSRPLEGVLYRFSYFMITFHAFFTYTACKYILLKLFSF